MAETCGFPRTLLRMGWRGGIACLAAALLQVIVLAEAMLPAPALPAVAMEGFSAFGLRETCSVHGIERVSSEEGPASDPAGGRHAPICVFCLLLLQAGVDLSSPMPEIAPLSVPRSVVGRFVAPVSPITARPPRANAPRAPPIA
ncbi:DUF2946 family protein [Telmatospirillum siberiense]|uniref:DUF2946 domain-containing protein n=1 Tax=Telmatospirillum siberiense TaxID=382514 RepID=A0A2N3Q1M1_9PROT|nr:hypothetical protein [Telmatospirillum siberiense]PKU26560.1 hypothetical protein CWS72_01595 [Telmatospirillum siberiense]